MRAFSDIQRLTDDAAVVAPRRRIPLLLCALLPVLLWLAPGAFAAPCHGAGQSVDAVAVHGGVAVAPAPGAPSSAARADRTVTVAHAATRTQNRMAPEVHADDGEGCCAGDGCSGCCCAASALPVAVTLPPVARDSVPPPAHAVNGVRPRPAALFRPPIVA